MAQPSTPPPTPPTPDAAAWAVLKLCADLDLRPGYALPLDKLFQNNAKAGKSRLTNEDFVGGVKLGAKCEWFETPGDQTYSLTEAGYEAMRRLDPGQW